MRARLAWLLLPVGRLFVLGRRSAVYDRWWKRMLVNLSGLVVTVEAGHHELERLTTDVAAHLRGRRGLLLFPEGGVEDGLEGRLRPLHVGAVRLASAARVLLAAGIQALFAPVPQPDGPRRARWLTGLLR